MSSAWSTVKATLVAAVEQTEPDDHVVFTSGGFVHQAQGIEGAHVPDRGFTILGSSGMAELPGCFQGKGRMSVTVNLGILYKAVTEVSILDDVIISDAENIIAQLLKESNWNRATSGIELVGSRNDDKSAIPFEVLFNEDASTTLLFTFPVTYARGVETNTPTP